MNETTSWTIMGAAAGLALLSLAATGAQSETPHAQKLALASLAADMAPGPGGTLPSQLLAEAYFDTARGKAAPGGFDDWYVRHEITLKGVAAQRGETLPPEDPAGHTLTAQDQSQLEQAARSLAEGQAYLAKQTNISGSPVLPLLAALQARYDWWLLLADAKAPRDEIEAARVRYEDTHAAFAAALQQSRIATL
jgi:hypothetical protein